MPKAALQHGMNYSSHGDGFDDMSEHLMYMQGKFAV